MSAERRWPDFEWSPEAEAEAHGVIIRAGVTSPTLARAVLNAAVGAQPVVALPPCPTCDGLKAVPDPDGAVQLKTESGSTVRARWCTACGGSGVERMVPEAALRAWIEEQRRTFVLDGGFERGYRAALNDLSVFLDSLHAEPGADRSER